MNKILTTLAVCLMAVFGASAADKTVSSELPEGAVSNINIERSESKLHVSLLVNPESVSKRRNRELTITPVVTNGIDTLFLSPVIVAGHNRYWQHKRHDGKNPDYVLLHSGDKTPYEYSRSVEFKDWMETGQLAVLSEVSGCCGDDLAPIVTDNLYAFDFSNNRMFEPAYVYVKPKKEIKKTREVSGEAYVDFPVNKTEIYPNYRRNPAELAEIRRTIDEVRSDKDVNITSLSIKGYASPEGAYANNERLAKGRTEALAHYVDQLYSFPKNVMHTSWEAEDWNGLERRVRDLDIDNKEEILSLIADTRLTPDAKDNAIKTRFPMQYKYLLDNVYPALRHSDYRVEFLVRNFTDLSEIADMMRTQPQKLSLDELFLYSKSLDENSPEFKEAMEVAVRLFPDDPIANLNAATTALQHNEIANARKYLAKAGNGADVLYTKGLLEAAEGNNAEALEYFKAAEKAGNAEASSAISQLRELGVDAETEQ